MVLVRMLTQDRRDRILKEGRKEGREEGREELIRELAARGIAVPPDIRDKQNDSTAQ